MNYVVIGGGISGLVAARALVDAREDAAVLLVERDKAVGGLLAGMDYPDQGLYFDTGTHVFQETGVSVIDEMLLDAVPPSDLIHFPVGKGDLAGAVFNGRLQANTHFPDLRGERMDDRVVESVRSHLAENDEFPDLAPVSPLLEAASARFGKSFANEVIGPVFERAFGQPAEALSAFAMLLTGWTRVVLDDHEKWSAKVRDEGYRSRVAVPDQRDLPRELSHGRRSFYSRREGSRAFVKGIADDLEARGVEITCGSTIVSMDPARCSLALLDSSGKERSYEPDAIVVSTGIVGASQLLGIDLSGKGLERPIPHWVIDVLLENPCSSDLCYLYGLDEGCDWYRVTNYRAITGDESDRRLTIEALGHDEVDPVRFPSACVRQMEAIGLLSDSGIEFAEARKLRSGFPAPTTRNFGGFAELGRELSGALPKNLLLCGIGTGNGLFFQNEVILDAYERLGEYACAG